MVQFETNLKMYIDAKYLLQTYMQLRDISET